MRASLSIEDTHGFRRIIDLEPREYSIGRRSQSDISFPAESTVSRLHARIFHLNKAFYIEDVGSSFGTFVNDQKITRTELQNGDQIRFGKCFHVKVLYIEESKIFNFSSENFSFMKKILQISKALNSSLILEQVLNMVMDAVLEVTSAERGFLMLKDEEGEYCIHIARTANKTSIAIESFKYSDSVVREVQRTGKSLIIQDIEDNSWLQSKESVIALELRSVMSVPLKIVHFATSVVSETVMFSNTDSKGMALSRDEMIGLVYVDSRVSNHSFTRMDLEILEALCSHAVISIHNSRLLRNLEKSEQFSTTLVDASKLLISTLNLEELLRIIIELANRTLESRRCALFLIDHQQELLRVKVLRGNEIVEQTMPLGTGIVGKVIAEGQLRNIRDVASISTGTELIGLESDEVFNLLCVPLRDKHNQIIGALETMNKIDADFNRDDEKMLEALSIHASLAIENAVLHREVIEKRKLEQEIEVAAEIQKRLLPENAPSTALYDIDAITLQCKYVGGDYYDFIAIDGERLGLALADVSGKGIPASLMMSNLQATLQSRALYDEDPSSVVTAVNNLIFRNSTANKYVTLVYCVLDLTTPRLHYTNAGHNPPLLRRCDGTWRELSVGGMVVGMFENVRYEQETIDLRPGEMIVIYTDGATEALNLRGEEFGVDRLCQTIDRFAHENATALCDRIYESIRSFEQTAERHDDLTLMIIKIS